MNRDIDNMFDKQRATFTVHCKKIVKGEDVHHLFNSRLTKEEKDCLIKKMFK